MEVILLLWTNDWNFTAVALIPLIQLLLIFEKREQWAKLSEEEKEKVLLSEDDVICLIKGVEKLVGEGETADTILEKIKED